ncbi:hypothetical protein [Viridibacterium curvum]|uniref:Uncharacterized protein n=1 Tax=Viridibacterium curvum TaxID=1101404 RepID=A0ABP9QCA1_9RHOO
MLLNVILIIGVVFCWIAAPLKIAIFVTFIAGFTALVLHLIRTQPSVRDNDNWSATDNVTSSSSSTSDYSSSSYLTSSDDNDSRSSCDVSDSSSSSSDSSSCDSSSSDSSSSGD